MKSFPFLLILQWFCCQHTNWFKYHQFPTPFESFSTKFFLSFFLFLAFWGKNSFSHEKWYKMRTRRGFCVCPMWHAPIFRISARKEEHKIFLILFSRPRRGVKWRERKKQKKTGKMWIEGKKKEKTSLDLVVTTGAGQKAKKSSYTEGRFFLGKCRIFFVLCFWMCVFMAVGGGALVTYKNGDTKRSLKIKLELSSFVRWGLCWTRKEKKNGKSDCGSLFKE